MGFSWQEYCSGLPFHFPGDLPALQADLTEEAQNLETHLYKHLGSVSQGPAGGAQGNKQLWLENVAVVFGVPGKQDCEHLLISVLCLHIPVERAQHSPPTLTYKTCSMVNAKTNLKPNYQKSPKQTKNLDKEKSNNIQFLIVL